MPNPFSAGKGSTPAYDPRAIYARAAAQSAQGQVSASATDKTGKAYHPLLYGRPKVVGEHIRKRYRIQLASLYAGMDPGNKDLSGKYTSNVDAKDGTKGQFTGAGFHIKTR